MNKELAMQLPSCLIVSFILISSHLISSHLISSHLISSHLISSHLNIQGYFKLDLFLLSYIYIHTLIGAFEWSITSSTSST